LKINILIVGKLRNSSEFKKQTIKWLQEDSSDIIKKIIYITWDTEDTRQIEEITDHYNKFRIIKLKQKFSNLRPNSTFKIQRTLFLQGLKEFKSSDLIYKTRTDVHTHFKYLRYLSEQKSLFSGAKIWVPNYSPESPGMFADIAFCGLKSQLMLLYNPTGLKSSARSSNGMKTHLDTWSGYIHRKIPRQIFFMNWLGDLFSIKENFIFYLISKDRVKGEYKKNLWEARHLSLIQHLEYKSLLELYKNDVQKAFLVGSKSKSLGSVYIRRQGKHYHSKESLYRKNTGNYVTENFSNDNKIRSFELLIKSLDRSVILKDINSNFKSKNKSLGGKFYFFTHIRLFGRPEINFLKASLSLFLWKTIHISKRYNKT
jgi:hypothetical protein